MAICALPTTVPDPTRANVAVATMTLADAPIVCVPVQVRGVLTDPLGLVADPPLPAWSMVTEDAPELRFGTTVWAGTANSCDNADVALALAVVAPDCAVLAEVAAAAAFVKAVDAFDEAVFAVEDVEAAAVLTVAGVFPVVDPPVSPCHRSSHPVCRLVAVVDRKFPNAVAVA